MIRWKSPHSAACLNDLNYRKGINVNSPSSKDPADSFDNLLLWLDSNRDRAAEKYETIRQQLIKMFSWQHVSDPEGLADETINRVMRKASELRHSYEGDPRLYFYAVARNLVREEFRRSRQLVELGTQEVVANSPDYENRDQLYDCLDKCLLTLPTPNRELLLAYYESSKQGTVDARQALAAQLRLHPATLRMRVHRIRTTLEKCIETCLKVTSGHKNT